MRKRLKSLDSLQGSRVGPSGIALVLTLLLVGLLLVMALSLVSLSSSDYLASANGSSSIQALYNADAGTEEAKMRISPSTVFPAAAANVNIPYTASPDWRAYIYSGSIANPTTAEMQSAIQSLDSTWGKKVYDLTKAEDTTKYAYYNTVQGANKITWGWARIQHKFDNIDPTKIVYWDVVNSGETTNATSTDAGGVTFDNLAIVTITSEGIQRKVKRMVEMQINPNPSTSVTTTDPFGNGAYGKSGVSLSGGPSTDSYNSADGAYGGTKDGTVNKGNDGNVVTDATGTGVIYVGPGGTVNGAAKIGVGGDTSTGVTIQGNGTITGGVEVLTTNVSTPPITIPTSGVTDKGTVSLASQTKKSDPSNPCDGASMVLGTGTYKMSSSDPTVPALKIAGNGFLCVTGPVVIYVDGNIDVGGNGIVNITGQPPNLLIYATNNCTTASIHGNGNFYGGVYAPNAEINIKGSSTSQMFGAASGNTIKLTGNGGFHYDEAMKHIGEWKTGNTSYLNYSRYSWREVPF
jgi:hypothetical protein